VLYARSPLAAILLLLCLGSATASAEPWYRGKYGRNRTTHLAISVTLGVAFLASETVLNDTLTTPNCRWCAPPSFDRAARNRLVWDDPARANFLSNMDAYVVAPVVGIGLLILSEHDASASRLIDDLLPIVETVAISQIITQVAKFSVARQRPYARFGTSTKVTNEDNLAFWSGHSALGWGITTSAGLIAHWRGYWTEPYIWGAGIAISVSNSYLRIAADEHYLSDAIVGGLVGVGSGLLIPRLMRRDLKLVPISNGVAVVGEF
jgi:PAP2 superfamily